MSGLTLGLMSLDVVDLEVSPAHPRHLPQNPAACSFDVQAACVIDKVPLQALHSLTTML